MFFLSKSKITIDEIKNNENVLKKMMIFCDSFPELSEDANNIQDIIDFMKKFKDERSYTMKQQGTFFQEQFNIYNALLIRYKDENNSDHKKIKRLKQFFRVA